MSGFFDLFTGDDPRSDEKPSSQSSVWNLFTEPGTPVDLPELRIAPSLCCQKFDLHSVFWAMRNLPIEEATKHFMVCGVTGSGKTTAIQLFLNSIAPRFRGTTGEPEQLIIFDAKCEIIPVLSDLGYGPEDENVWILNPFDERAAVWPFADAVQEPAMARYLATLLIPEEKHQGRFFTDASRELLYAVVLALNDRAGTAWTFRDLISALESPATIKAVTRNTPRAFAIAKSIVNDEKHSSAVLSTLTTRTGPFEQVAALWSTSRNKRVFSIKEFLSKPGVLILGNDEVLKDSLWPINALLLKALTHEILRRPGPTTRLPRHWFVLDEFRWMEKVECIHDLLNRGRSKGASVLIGIQSLEGMIEVYKEPVANDILSQCANKTFLRAGGPKTAEWAEKFFGKVRHTINVYSETSGKHPSSSVNHALQEHALFLDSTFLNLPFPTPGSDYVAINDVPALNCTLITKRPFNEVLSWTAKPPHSFSVGQILNIGSLAAKLSAEEPDAVSKFVISRFSPEAKNALSAFNGKAPDAMRRLLVKELNQIIASESVLDSRAFEGVSLSARTNEILGASEHEFQTRALNQSLLVDAFPKELTLEPVPAIILRSTVSEQTLKPWTKTEKAKFCSPKNKTADDSVQKVSAPTAEPTHYPPRQPVDRPDPPLPLDF